MTRREPGGKPRRAPWVVLFCGHMLDAPRCRIERFPPDMAPFVTAEIVLRLALLDTGPGDLALCEGACGGSLLFAEAALARGMRLELRLPFGEDRFLRESVAFGGQAWLARYARVRGDPDTLLYCLPEDALHPGCDPFDEVGRWQLDAALSHGTDRVWLMTLWDGGRGAGQDSGAVKLMDTIGRYTGQVIPIDAARLLRRTRERRRD